MSTGYWSGNFGSAFGSIAIRELPAQPCHRGSDSITVREVPRVPGVHLPNHLSSRPSVQVVPVPVPRRTVRQPDGIGELLDALRVSFLFAFGMLSKLFIIFINAIIIYIIIYYKHSIIYNK